MPSSHGSGFHLTSRSRKRRSATLALKRNSLDLSCCGESPLPPPRTSSRPQSRDSKSEQGHTTTRTRCVSFDAQGASRSTFRRPSPLLEESSSHATDYGSASPPSKSDMMLRSRSPYFEGALSPFRRAAQIVSKSRDPSPNRSASMPAGPSGASPKHAAAAAASSNSTPHASPQSTRRTGRKERDESTGHLMFPGASTPPQHRRTESEHTPTAGVPTRPSPSRALSSSAVGRNLEAAFSTSRSHHLAAPTARQAPRPVAWTNGNVSSGGSSECSSESSGSSYSMESGAGGVESYAGSRTNLTLAEPFAQERFDVEADQLKDCLDRLELRSLASTDSLDILALGFPAPPTTPLRPTLREMRGMGVRPHLAAAAASVERGAVSDEEVYVAPPVELFTERRPSSLRERRAKEPITISLAQTKVRPSFSPALSVRSPPPCPPPSTPLPELPNTPRYTPRSTPRSSGRLASPPHSRPGSSGSGSEEVLASTSGSASGSERSFPRRMRSATLVAPRAPSSTLSEQDSDAGYESCRSSPMSPTLPLTPLDHAAHFTTPTVARLMGGGKKGARSVSVISKASSDASSSAHSTLESIANALNLDGFESPAYHDAPLPEEDGVTYGYAM